MTIDLSRSIISLLVDANHYCMLYYKNPCMLQFGSILSLIETTLHGGSVGMAQIKLPPPDRFNFRNPDDWPRWRRRFQQFREASGLSDESAAKQISTLLYCLGEEAESVLASTNATAETSTVQSASLTITSRFVRT